MPPGALSTSCAGVPSLTLARRTGRKTRFGARWDSNVCSLPQEPLGSEQCKASAPHLTAPEPAWSFQTLLSAVLRWDTASIPLLSLASVMLWQLTEEAGGGSKVRKDFGNFPSTSEIVPPAQNPTADWFPVHLRSVSQVGNTLNRR